MFFKSSYFDGELNNWTITDPTSMQGMFHDCLYFTGNGLSSWIVMSPQGLEYSMYRMFRSCLSLGNEQDIDISQSAVYTSSYNLFTDKQFSTNDQGSDDSHLTNSNTISIGNINHIVGLVASNAIYEGLDYWALDSSDGTVVVAAMDNSYVRMVKIDINGNTISDPITNRYNSDLSAISSKADLIDRWTTGTSQPSSGYYIFEKSSNFDSIVNKLNDNNIVYQHDFTGLEIGGDVPSMYYETQVEQSLLL